MKDSSRFLLLYIDMLHRSKDNEIADFLMNTAYFLEDNQNIDLHSYSITELVKIRENIIKSFMEEISKELDEEILKPIKYKLDCYDGQINMCERFYALDIPNRMKNAVIRRSD